MQISKESLILIFKAKLLIIKTNNLSTLFNVPATDGAISIFANNQALFHRGLISANFALSETRSLLLAYSMVTLIKERLTNLTVALGRFVTSKKREFDFRIKSGPMPIDFKLFSTSIVFGGAEKLEKIKLSAAVKVPPFNFANFVKPHFVYNNHLEYLFPYIKTFDFYFRQSMFKRLSFTYFKVWNATSLLRLSFAILKFCFGFALYGYAKVHSIPPGIPKNRWKWVKAKDRIVRRLKLALSRNFFFAELGLFSLRNLARAFFVLLDNAELFQESALKTGLVLYVSGAARARASRGIDDKSEYEEIRNFNFHYPFTQLEFRPEAPRSANIKFHKFGKPKWRKPNLFTKFVWWPKRFSDTFFSNKPALDRGVFLNGYNKKHAFVNKDLLRISSKLYPLWFSGSFKIFEFWKFDSLLRRLKHYQK